MMEVARVLRLDLLIKLSLAVFLGGIIGFERELSGKPAGLRTNILICLGAALLMDVSNRIGLVDGQRIGDPARIAAQVVSGVGFLGAGTIMQAQGVVTGLTSAATIWVVAAIGLTVGGGFYVEALGAGLLVTFVLAGLGRLEIYVRRLRRRVTATIRTQVGTTPEDVDGGAQGARHRDRAPAGVRPCGGPDVRAQAGGPVAAVRGRRRGADATRRSSSE